MSTQEQKNRYRELILKRDRLNNEVRPMQESLTALNTKIALLQKESMDLALKISNHRGGQHWLDMKTEIAQLVNAGAHREPVKPASIVKVPFVEEIPIEVVVPPVTGTSSFLKRLVI